VFSASGRESPDGCPKCSPRAKRIIPTPLSFRCPQEVQGRIGKITGVFFRARTQYSPCMVPHGAKAPERPAFALTPPGQSLRQHHLHIGVQPPKHDDSAHAGAGLLSPGRRVGVQGVQNFVDVQRIRSAGTSACPADIDRPSFLRGVLDTHTASDAMLLIRMHFPCGCPKYLPSARR
jgi:hypothetical protein